MSVLVLSVLRCPDGAAPETRRVTGGEYTIGRGADNDWVLDDPERVLSKRHCVVGYRGGAWHVTDTSTNGLFLNREADPLGRDQVQELRDGDRLRLGLWEIEARFEQDTDTTRDPFGGMPADHGAHRFTAPPRNDDAFSLDPFADHAPPGARNPFDEPPDNRLDLASAALPADFDPLAPDPAPDFAGPTEQDHTPSFGDAFRPPAVHHPLAQGGAVLGAGPIPDDFDPFAPEEPAPATSAAPAGRLPDDFDFDFDPLAPAPVAPVAAPAPPSTPEADDDFIEFDPAPRPSSPGGDVAPARPAAPPLPPVSAPLSPAAAGGDLLAAFLRGARLPDATIADPTASMEQLGAAFRALVSGLRRALIARASVKGEFRIEQTMIRSRGNNPLKFSAGDDDALAALIGAGRRIDMDAPQAVEDALEDIRLHELASVAAMQSAIRALVERLDPAPLLAGAKGGLLPGQKKAAAFEEYEALHGKVAAALMDDFDSVFGKAFARAYEQALAEAKARPRD